jgi:hypothetical protein
VVPSEVIGAKKLVMACIVVGDEVGLGNADLTSSKNSNAKSNPRTLQP